MNLKQQKPRNQKRWTEKQERELFSYHNKNLGYKEVAKLMGLPEQRVKNKSHKMGICLNGR